MANLRKEGYAAAAAAAAIERIRIPNGSATHKSFDEAQLPELINSSVPTFGPSVIIAGVIFEVLGFDGMRIVSQQFPDGRDIAVAIVKIDGRDGEFAVPVRELLGTKPDLARLNKDRWTEESLKAIEAHKEGDISFSEQELPAERAKKLFEAGRIKVEHVTSYTNPRMVSQPDGSQRQQNIVNRLFTLNKAA